MNKRNHYMINLCKIKREKKQKLKFINTLKNALKLMD